MKKKCNKQLRYKLDLYSYIIGRILLKHPNARIEILNKIKNNILDLNNILSKNKIIRINFLYELNHLYVNRFGLNIKGEPSINRPMGIKPPITIKYYNIAIYNKIATKIKNEILSNNYNDCLEMYVVKPFNFNCKKTKPMIIHTVPHSLSDIEFPFGFSLSFDSFLCDSGYNKLFNNAFFCEHTKNIILIRPVRNNVCTYNDINVMDFRLYYKN